MAIYRVSGQMLQSTLVRDGNSIAFANTANSTATLFVDVSNSRVGINSNVANVALDVNGNIFTLDLSSTGNVTAANINGTVVSATGNVIGGNVSTAGLITATGNITGGNVLTAGIMSSTGNVTAGNILTGGLISATGNLTSGNVNTTLVSATGNVNAGNVVVGNIVIPGTGNVTLGNVNINYLSTPVANSDAATKGYVDTSTSTAFGNITISNTTISTSLANGNITLTATGTQLVQVSGSGGFTVPSGNVDQRPGSPGVGTIRFNNTNIQLEVWTGAQWQAASNYSSVITNQTINGDGSTVTFALDQGATAESIVVSINGVVQTPGVDYTTTVAPDEITFTTAPHGGDVIQVRFIVATTTIYALINGTSSVSIPASSGNITLSANGIANVVTVSSSGIVITGNSTVSGLDIVNPNYITISSSGTTETLSSTKSVNLLLLANTGYTTTVNMPATPVDGQVVEFAVSGNTVTLVAGTGTLTSSFAGPVTIGAGFKYVYRTADATWYRLQ
jgi:hypothetical protein